VCRLAAKVGGYLQCPCLPDPVLAGPSAESGGLLGTPAHTNQYVDQLINQSISQIKSNQINIFINSSKEKKRNTTAKGMEGQK